MFGYFGRVDLFGKEIYNCVLNSCTWNTLRGPV
jgi:hypothetical protein